MVQWLQDLDINPYTIDPYSQSQLSVDLKLLFPNLYKQLFQDNSKHSSSHKSKRCIEYECKRKFCTFCLQTNFEENLNDEETSGDLPPDEAPLEGEDDESSEEEEDGDLVVYDVEDWQNHFHTIGKKGDLITKIKMDDTWVRVTMRTPLDAKHQLPPRFKAKVQRHKDTDAGAEKWQAWYPGAEPQSHHRTGPTAREEVLQWCQERHAEYLKAIKGDAELVYAELD